MSCPFCVRAARPPRARPPRFPAAAAEERAEKVGERILVAEEILHLVGRHGAVAAARPAHVDRPGILRTAAAERAAAGEALPLLLGLFVHPPVRAELVVLAALVGVAEHLVRFVDLLELGLGGLVARVDVGMELPGKLAERLLDLFSVAVLATPSVW